MECPTTNNQANRVLCDVPQTSKSSPAFRLTFFSVPAGLTAHRNIFCLHKTFSVHFLPIISFRALSIQVNGTICNRNGHHRQHHHQHQHQILLKVKLDAKVLNSDNPWLHGDNDFYCSYVIVPNVPSVVSFNVFFTL